MTKTTRRRALERKIVEALILGKTQRWICQNHHISDRKVRRIRALAETHGYLRDIPLPPYPEAIFSDPIDGRTDKPSEINDLLLLRKGWIEERLNAGWHPITVFEEIDVPVGRASFYRFLHRHGLFNVGKTYRRVIPEIVHQPGEALQLDWGKFRDVIDPETHRKRTLWAFVGVLGYSRFTMRLVWSNDSVTTLRAIESMLKELDGVPAKVTSDNPKCFAIVASVYEPILNPAFERFAHHYGFIIECLPPRDPQKKGKVERQMPYIRRLYEAHGPSWSGVEESQSYLDQKLAIANERKHGTTQRRPIDDLLAVESNSLKPLPAVSYPMEEFAEGKVRQDGHVRFNNKYYSVDEAHIGQEVFLIGSSSLVNIYYQGKLIEVHERLWDSKRSKQTKAHHLKPWEQSMREDSFYRKQAQKIGPDVERLILIFLEQGQGFIDTRKIWGILTFDKKYAPEAINEACRQAIDLQSFSYRTVERLLKLAVKEPHEEKYHTRSGKQNKFTRSLSDYKEQLKLKLKR
ncbi:MAG: Mu transposase domain-containing protein [Nitrospiria bacterium]